ncbi:MAG TPA: cytochrome c [Pyrinomonadaceae bacterium]|jgi:mono/diheme cytochrome c family protein
MNRFLKGVVVCSALLLLLAVLVMPTRIASGAFQRPRSSRVKHVDELFNRNCARCHGADGRGDTPLGHLYKAPDFTDSEWWKKNSDISGVNTLRSIVTRGKAGMPAFGKKLRRAEINLLVDRIRSFRKFERKS